MQILYRYWHISSTPSLLQIAICPHGPAQVLKIKTIKSGYEFSVDLVPVIQFKLDRLNSHPRIRNKMGVMSKVSTLKGICQSVFNSILSLLSTLTSSTWFPRATTRGRSLWHSWRKTSSQAMSGPQSDSSRQAENMIIFVKYLEHFFFLIQHLRDCNDPPLGKHLSSYALKTVVMHLMEEVKDPETFWRQDNMPEAFLAALEKLIFYLNPDRNM